jgi:hypothetical protein
MSVDSVDLPLESLDAGCKLGDLATQLVRLSGSCTQLAQLEPDLGNLARDEFPELCDLALEPGDAFGQRVHALGERVDALGECVHALAKLRNVAAQLGAQFGDLAAQLGAHFGDLAAQLGAHFGDLAAQLDAPLQELRLLELEVAVRTRKTRPHRFAQLREPCVHGRAQVRDRGSSLVVHLFVLPLFVLTPLEPVDAGCQLRNLATQLVDVHGALTQFAQLESDLGELARDEVAQL